MSDNTQWWHQLTELGKSQGFLTHKQVNGLLPPAYVDPVQIGAIVDRIQELGIRVVPDDSPEAI